MSKLGLHVSSGDRFGFGDLLKKCADAKSPVPVIFSVGQDVWPDVQKYSPSTKIIYRVQPSTGAKDGPQDAYKGDAVQSARAWMALVMPNWAKNKANYYAPLNEFDPGDLAGYRWLNDFTIECMKIAEAAGYKLALYAFSTGNPRDDVGFVAALKLLAEAIQGANPLYKTGSAEEKWYQLIPSLQHAKANGHILLLHEYGLASKAANGGPESSLRSSAPYMATRYRRSLSFLKQFNADPPVVISEASAGVGGLSIGQDAWLADAEWYDSELMKDPGVLGCCLYQAGGAENIKAIFPRLADYISKTPDNQSPTFPTVKMKVVATPLMNVRRDSSTKAMVAGQVRTGRIVYCLTYVSADADNCHWRRISDNPHDEFSGYWLAETQGTAHYLVEA